jgi:hypothetical protein
MKKMAIFMRFNSKEETQDTDGDGEGIHKVIAIEIETLYMAGEILIGVRFAY